MRRLEWGMRQSGLRYLVRMATGMILLTLFNHASAQSVCQDIGPDAYTIKMPATLTVPRDAVVGTLLSPWISTPQVTSYYGCVASVGAATGVEFVATNLTSSGKTTVNAGVTYTVFNTNVAGVGVAISVRSYLNACGWQGPHDLDVIESNARWACTGTGAALNGGAASAALVKTGPTTGGLTSGGVLFQATAVVQPTRGGETVPQNGIVKKQFSLSPTIIVGLACSTPDVTVSMGLYKISAFTGKGSSTRPVRFNVAVNSCPPGMTKIQYQFDAPGGVTDTTNGVIALTAASTATGIGLKLMDRSSVALKFDTQYQLSGYNAATGGSYTIPLQAAYYQTAAAITGGTANAIMTFTMTYQ
jgi:major type 1 subunit fimbrin (pilin)